LWNNGFYKRTSISSLEKFTFSLVRRIKQTFGSYEGQKAVNELVYIMENKLDNEILDLILVHTALDSSEIKLNALYRVSDVSRKTIVASMASNLRDPNIFVEDILPYNKTILTNPGIHWIIQYGFGIHVASVCMTVIKTNVLHIKHTGQSDLFRVMYAIIQADL
jgi:hypothetical protein